MIAGLFLILVLVALFAALVLRVRAVHRACPPGEVEQDRGYPADDS